MKKKYVMTNETMNFGNKILHRIKALRDFGDVNAGDLGGYIEKEDNLSHEGNCWVYDTAHVYGNAQVFGNACVSGNAAVFGIARVFDNAWVFGYTWISGNAWVYDNARVSGDAWVYDTARVSGDARVFGNARVCGNAYIKSNDDYIIVSNIGSRHDTTTFFKCEDNTIKVSCGCFKGTIEEFEKAVEKTHGDNKYGKEYRMIIDLANAYLGG